MKNLLITNKQVYTSIADFLVEIPEGILQIMVSYIPLLVIDINWCVCESSVTHAQFPSWLL